MALEAVVSPQDMFGYWCKDFCSSGLGLGGYEFGLQELEDKALLGILDGQVYQQQGLHCTSWPESSPPSVIQSVKDWDPNSSPEACTVDQPLSEPPLFPASMEPAMTTGRRKRRRTKSPKNKEEIENQRMTHIAVERNRRKQMNGYLAVLRSLMPPSYVQRGDQASIIGGAINFVKELEQHLQFIKAQKQAENNGVSSPFAEFFSFPQYSTPATQCKNTGDLGKESMGQSNWSAADIEVTMVDSHANLKILSKKRPRQLLKMVAGFQSLRLGILHLNVTTMDQMVLYSVSVKVEEGCHLNTVDEIAAAVNQMLSAIQEEAVFS